ncbi:MAG: oligosaccharide flippase family protein [Oscillospiraceae bacterium]|nr:oligosaccharide flippase family protein [Oscillospiraceae bacterium]
MNRYKFLFSNTVLFFISSFSSKFLVFLLMPIYTAVLSPAENSDVSLMMQTANLLIPLVSLGISNSIIRFGLDDKYSKRTVFTTGVFTLGAGYLLLIAAFPLLNRVEFIHKYIWMLYLYLLMSCSRTLVQQFVRAKTYTKLYAFDGILATVNTLILVCVFLLKFRWGAMGYIAAIIGADFLSVVFLSVITSVWRYFDISKLDKEVAKEMLKYCLPLIPASIAWWITNVSDRYLVAYFCGDTVNGIYDISYKLPSIINVFATIFLEAWQISAVKESGEKHTSRFFGNVFKAYQSVVFIGGAGIILLCKPLIKLLADEAYFEAWTFVPVLIMATIFACFSTFMTSIYMVEKRGGLNLATMSAGAVANIALNLILIPKIGAQGAAIATFASYVLVFALRAINTRKFIDINISPIQLIINVALTGGMSYAMIAGIHHNVIISIVITLLIMAVNIKPLLGFALQLLKGLTKRKRGKA